MCIFVIRDNSTKTLIFCKYKSIIPSDTKSVKDKTLKYIKIGTINIYLYYY
jgi:hypothetical protein